MNVSEKTKTLCLPESNPGSIVQLSAMSSRRNHFDTAHIQAGLKGRSIRAGVVTLASQGVLLALNVIQIVVLSRLLSPSDFGLFAMVTVLTGLVTTFKDGGLSMATIQRAEITHDQISTLYWINVLIGIILTLTVAASAPLLAWFYEEPRLTGVTLLIAGTFFVSSLATQHQALIRRQMRFKALAIIQVTALMAGVGGTIVAALMDAGYWSLPVLPVTQSIVETVATWICSGWIPGRPKRRTEIRSMLGFGGNLTAAACLNYLGANVDKILIGKWIGPVQLGLYDRASRLLMLPLSQISAPVSAVAIPALSRIVQEPDRYRSGFVETVQKLLIILGPTIAFAVVCSDWMMYLALGPQWNGADHIFSLLALASLPLPLWNATSWLFVSQGRMREHLIFHTCDSPLRIIIVIIGLQWGITGVSIAIAVRYYLVSPFLYWYVGRSGPVRTVDLYLVWILPAIIISSVLVVVSAFRQVLPGHLQPIWGLVVCAVATLSVALLCLMLFPSGRGTLRSLMQDFKTLQARA